MMSPFTVVQDCGCLPDITNGRVELNPNTLPGSVATYSCNQGHSLIGDANRTCESGTWSGAEPTCRTSVLHNIMYMLVVGIKG